MDSKNDKKNMIFNICSNHIGGMLGETLLYYFLKNKLIEKQDEDYYLTENGYEKLELIGIDIDSIISSSKTVVKICFESEDGILYEHIGSLLGTLIMERMIELEWIHKIDDSTIKLTSKGIDGLQSIGIKLKNNLYAS